jgi:hypothetical protein
MSKKSEAAVPACSVCGEDLGENVVPAFVGGATVCPRCFCKGRPGCAAVKCVRCGKVCVAVGSKSCPQCNFRVTNPV